MYKSIWIVSNKHDQRKISYPGVKSGRKFDLNANFADLLKPV